MDKNGNIDNVDNGVEITVFQSLNLTTEVPFSVPTNIYNLGVNAVLDYVQNHLEELPYGNISSDNVQYRDCHYVETAEALMKCYKEHGL